MAHLVKVRYGLSNLSKKEYTYIANNNVKKGTVIMPSVKHAVSGKIYATMGVVQSTQGGNQVKKTLTELNNKGINVVDTEKVDRAVVNSLRARDEATGKFIYTGEKGFKSQGKSSGEYAFAFDDRYNKNNEAVLAQKQRVTNTRIESDKKITSEPQTFDSYWDSTLGKENK
jgi:hypothetical protein